MGIPLGAMSVNNRGILRAAHKAQYIRSLSYVNHNMLCITSVEKGVQFVGYLWKKWG